MRYRFEAAVRRRRPVAHHAAYADQDDVRRGAVDDVEDLRRALGESLRLVQWFDIHPPDISGIHDASTTGLRAPHELDNFNHQ